MEHTLIIVIYLCGLISMVIELFLPGAIIGIIGFLAVSGSVVYAYVNGFNVTGTVLMLCTVAWVPLFFILWKNVIGRFFALKGSEEGFRSSTSIDESLLGKEGLTSTPLRPSGIAMLDGERCGVVTRGEMLDRNVSVKVIDVTGNRIVVKKV